VTKTVSAAGTEITETATSVSGAAVDAGEAVVAVESDATPST
jgi:hypothetical protein